MKHRQSIGVYRGMTEFFETGTTRYVRRFQYEYPDIYPDYESAGTIINDVCIMAKTTPENLGIRVSKRGRFARLIAIRNGDITIVGTRGDEGYEIPNNVYGIEILESNVRFILIVEKETVFGRLVHDRVFDELGCIMVTGGATVKIDSKICGEAESTIGIVDCCFDRQQWVWILDSK